MTLSTSTSPVADSEPVPGGALNFAHVLDLSESVAGQFCCRMLADYGAEVTLIEPPTGSVIRSKGPFHDADGPGRESQLFFHLNLGKKSMVVDQATESGRQLLLSLARKADVIVIPLGVDREALRTASPNAIVATVSPFGEDGPMRDWRGTEMIYQAMSGMMIQNGAAEREPLYGTGERASYCGGLAAYISILSALMVRERCGKSQHVAVDMAHTAASMTYPFALQYEYNGSFEHRGNRGQPLLELKCADGYMSAWVRPHQFATICEVMQAPDLATDSHFMTAAARQDNFKELLVLLQRAVANQSAPDIVAKLQSQRIVAACCFYPDQLGPQAPHLKERKFWHEVDTPTGPRPALGPQFRMSRTPRRPLEALREVARGRLDAKVAR